jgi:hypothetical protein
MNYLKKFRFLNESKIKDIEIITHLTIHILPLIKIILKLNYKDFIHCSHCFHPEFHPKRLYMNTCDNLKNT